MICVFDKDNLNFEGNGNAVLLPTEAKVRSVAGGNYDLTMVHPMEPEGKWKHLVPGAIVRAPIPEEEIENAFSGYEADVYKTTEDAELREGPSEPTVISYTAWAVGNSYAVGTKVTFLNKNYECTYWDAGSGFIYLDPAHSSWWKEIARYTSGSAVLVSLPAGSELYFVQDYDSTWYKMSTYYGVEGYIKKSQVEFYKHLSQDETKPRIIREQLFRITNATADTKSHVVNVTAQHVSYDLNGIIVQDVSIRQASPAMAIGRMVEGFMIPYDGTIATNLTSDDNGTYTDDIKGKTGMYCFLDPDKGIVGKFDAALKRDNWDLFILQKTNTNRGFSIRYRKNLLGVSWARKSDGLITRVVPVAKDEKGEALYLPEKWIDSDYINDYPVIRMERLSMKEQVGKDKGTGDGSTWTLSDLYDEMRAKAAERFTVDKVDRIVDEVTVDFEQLGDTDEHAALKGFEKVLLYDAVTVIHEEIGLNMVMTVNELEWDAIRQKITSVKVSNVGNRAGRSVTGYNVQNKSIGWQKLTDDVGDDILSQVRDIIPEYADPEAPRPAIPVMNTKTQDGYVLKGGSNANKVWGTDASGNPGWRDEGGADVFFQITESGTYLKDLPDGLYNATSTIVATIPDMPGGFPSGNGMRLIVNRSESGAGYYMIQSFNNTFMALGSKYANGTISWQTLHPIPEATTSAAGLMSSTDKTKLDEIGPWTFTYLGFNIATSSWTLSSGRYTYTLTDAAITVNTTEDVYFSESANDAVRRRMSWEKSGASIIFSTPDLPIAAVTGMIRVIGSAGNTKMVDIGSGVVPVSKGGTGAANAAGAKQNLGLITEIVMNGASKGTSGVVNLGTVVTDVSGKADKVANATNNNFAALDANGNLKDSGHKHSDYLTEHQDISGKADKANTVLDTTLSRGRKAGTQTTTGSCAFGNDVEASGGYSHAEGGDTKATVLYAHAEGQTTEASGLRAHAEGYCTFATGNQAHAEGYDTTAAGSASHAEGRFTYAYEQGSHAEGISCKTYGWHSHAEGEETIACGENEHVSGKYNVQEVPNWISGTSYAVNDYVIYDNTVHRCITANSDTTFTSSKWIEGASYDGAAEIVGGGSSNTRKNIRKLDWNGNEYLKNDIYVRCGNDSTGGTPLHPIDGDMQIYVPPVHADTVYTNYGLGKIAFIEFSATNPKMFKSDITITYDSTNNRTYYSFLQRAEQSGYLNYAYQYQGVVS